MLPTGSKHSEGGKTSRTGANSVKPAAQVAAIDKRGKTSIWWLVWDVPCEPKIYRFAALVGCRSRQVLELVNVWKLHMLNKFL